MADWDTALSNKRVLIELTDHCNLSCVMCANRRAPHGIKQGFMDFGLYKRILREVDLSTGWSLELFWLGESLLHPQFNGILEYTREQVKNTRSHVNLHTNAIPLDKAKQKLILSFGKSFPWITFSVDAVNQATYKRIRGGELATVNRNIKSFLLMRKQLNSTYPNVNIQFILMKENAQEAKQFAEYWRGFYKENQIHSQDNIFFKRIEVHDINEQEKANKLYDNTIEKFNLFTKASEGINVLSKNKKPKPVYWFEEKQRRVCAAPFKNPVIRWDGEMTVCCFDDIFLYSIGNLNEHSFRELWYGEQMDNFRKKHIEGRYDELLTNDGWNKCEKCIGYYWPIITKEEIETYKSFKS